MEHHTRSVNMSRTDTQYKLLLDCYKAQSRQSSSNSSSHTLGSSVLEAFASRNSAAGRRWHSMEYCCSLAVLMCGFACILVNSPTCSLSSMIVFLM
jgi:hypothetical protein